MILHVFKTHLFEDISVKPSTDIHSLDIVKYLRQNIIFDENIDIFIQETGDFGCQNNL